MPKFIIEGIEYNTEDLSERGSANLISLKYTDEKIKELEAEIKIYETAQRAYLIAMKNELSGIEK